MMINLLICGNSGVRDGMILTALSLVKSSSRAVTMYIGTMELCELDARYTPITEEDAALIDEILKEGNPDSRAVLLDMGEGFKRTMLESKNIGTSYTPYTMLRLVADMYELPDKLLYIDTDVLFRGDVGELYDVDVSEYELAAVKDYYGHRFISPRYFNAGVLLLNMTAMKKSGLFERARSLCIEKKMLLCDQSALNRCVKRKLLLPRRFNEQHKLMHDTVLQHFSMRIRWIPLRTEKIKPWQPELLHERLGIYCYDDIIARWQEIRSNGYKTGG